MSQALNGIRVIDMSESIDQPRQAATAIASTSPAFDD
jgi:hypothetical protein